MTAKASVRLVATTTIAQATLHQPVPLIRHAYSAPFSIVYLGWLYLYVALYDDLFGSKEFAMLTLILAIAANVLALLACQWSVKAKALMTCIEVSDPTKASIIMIIPAAHQGSGALCPIETAQINGEYIFNADKKVFEELRFPVDESKTISDFQNTRGLVDDSEITAATDLYGFNRFDVPIPTFFELFKEHAVAPFFVFQLFCVALWFLDEMWYYSLFTLFMLVVFESTVVMQRLKNLQEFRAMSIKPYPIKVYRKKIWIQIQTDELLPGDICSIRRSEEDCPVPADLVVIDGSCIANEAMLSGESTPQLKESVAVRDNSDVFDMDIDKNQVLFGGTKILQVTAPVAGSAIIAPDGGCVACVLKTGFSTQQGKLVRTIIYSTERITANNAESLYFILFLLIFAIAASYYVWTEGIKNEERKKEKILLDCILIITSVVPPELPMELSMAVNNSLLALVKQYIFCTEPFRIPFAGKIDVACFDKTGTLTAENLLVEGVSGLGTDSKRLWKTLEVPKQTTLVLAAAHALVQLDDGIIGDPMEKNTLESIEWNLGKDEFVRPKKAAGLSKLELKIVRRFPFSSALKRMSTLSLLNDDGKSQILITVKGAPETLKGMFSSVPSDYDEIYKYWARRGSRVLALGYRIASEIKPNQIREVHRDAVESKLIFAGFLIFFCPLKPDSADAIEMLNNSSHRCVMITGDNALTACHVAKEVKIVSKPVLILDVRDNKLAWQSVDEDVTLDIDVDNRPRDPRLANFELCITGRGLAEIFHTLCFAALLPRLWVYARVSPSQKEDILNALKNAGYHTLMCGDGTNDVGALKQAHVGIALLDGNKDEIEKFNKNITERRKLEIAKKQTELREKLGWKPLEGMPGQPAAGTGGRAVAPPKDPKEQFAKQMEALNAMLGDMEDLEAPQIKFGDASVAAPFTSKLGTVMSVVNIIRQGRATLVAMVQMYKILALNCLISAYSMSVMYLAGIKQGDWQATIAGILITICFFGVAKSSAVERLSKKRPQANVFNHYIIISVLGQVAIHISSLVYIRSQAIEYSEELDEIRLDAEFQPNLLNSAVYLVSLIMQISTFAINYQGEPFRESIFKNKAMYNSLLMVTGIAVLAASELSPELNSSMQLVPFPDDFRYKLIATMAFDFGGAWVVEMITNYLFSDNRAKEELF
ncbi:hypothetical protein HK100_006575 [Physocladia obscura]|uniref:Uncharacterized protein n=1 Tax=Physocladia obscura TaxID=109957 RepID=A0AAD5T5C3_9FUNG|nr:hypothetical protein HK100_006575 [Physocladia obscura]